MNRRDFLKGAILLPSLMSLLPVLARAPKPLSARLAVECPDEGFVFLSRINHYFDGPGLPGLTWAKRIPERTSLEYGGTFERLQELTRLFRESDLISTAFIQNLQDVHDETGFVIAHIFLGCELRVMLRGCWIAQLGAVERGQTGCKVLGSDPLLN